MPVGQPEGSHQDRRVLWPGKAPGFSTLSETHESYGRGIESTGRSALSIVSGRTLRFFNVNDGSGSAALKCTDISLTLSVKTVPENEKYTE